MTNKTIPHLTQIQTVTSNHTISEETPLPITLCANRITIAKRLIENILDHGRIPKHPSQTLTCLAKMYYFFSRSEPVYCWLSLKYISVPPGRYRLAVESLKPQQLINMNLSIEKIENLEEVEKLGQKLKEFRDNIEYTNELPNPEDTAVALQILQHILRRADGEYCLKIYLSHEYWVL